jgi:hypothetical protein
MRRSKPRHSAKKGLPRQPRALPGMTKEEVAIQLIRGIWDSLESHLDYCVEDSSDGKPFHRTCVKDYAAQLKLAAELL